HVPVIAPIYERSPLAHSPRRGYCALGLTLLAQDVRCERCYYQKEIDCETEQRVEGSPGGHAFRHHGGAGSARPDCRIHPLDLWEELSRIEEAKGADYPLKWRKYRSNDGEPDMPALPSSPPAPAK